MAGHAEGTPQEGSPGDRLSRLIAAGDVTALFQPIVDVERGTIAGRETLARPGPSSGYSNAGELFEEAEELGRLWELEAVTRSKSIAASREWSDGSQLFLNTTPQVLSDPRFPGELVTLVRGTPGLNPGRIVIEVTERSDQHYTEALVQQVTVLKSQGFEIAIDDVGAGTSGLNRIMALKPRWLKLDRDLVENIHLDRAKQNLIRFFLHFARMSSVKVIAEGIEKREELGALIDLGVRYAQGYLLARPGSREVGLEPELLAWVSERQAARRSASFADPRRTPVSRWSRQVLCVDGRMSVSDAAAMMLRDARAVGAAVTESGRYVGWCGRDELLRSAGDGRSGLPVGFIAHKESPLVSTETPVTEALEIAAAREDRAASEPLVLGEQGVVSGIATVGELLAAAAAIARDVQDRTAPVTGLPARVRADEHVASLIAEAKSRPGRSGDAAVVDIRNFAAFNAVVGYELGDQLLQRVVALLRTEVVRGEAGVFLAHLESDRFLLTAPSGVLAGRLRGMLETFDVTGETERPGEGSGRGGVGLRAVLVPDAFAGAETPADVYRAARDARGTDEGEGSRLIVAGIQRARLSA